MTFSSFQFLFYFLPAFLALNFLLPGTRARNLNILVFSLLFYTWGEAGYVLVFVVSALFNWCFGLLIDAAAAAGRRKAVLLAGVFLNLLFLVYFKYTLFIVEAVTGAPAATGNPYLDIHMPLGVSFFTFHAISYLIDIHRREISAQRNFLTFFAYQSLFPQLIAGPIVRYAQVRAQLLQRSVSLADVVSGLGLFAVGLMQKVLLANQSGLVADKVFDAPVESIGSAAAWIGTYAYTLQIYFDFCGYSLMAIGLGRVMGFTFPDNFRLPYVALSITDFWRRWHITLSSWFRDYLYKPLGGNRHGLARTVFNLFLVFALCGLWHGASWIFLLWGLYHGLLLSLEKFFLLGAIVRMPVLLRWAYAFLAVMIGWVLFRSDSVTHAWQILLRLVGQAEPPAVAVLQVTVRDLLPYESMLSLALASFFAFGLWGALQRRLAALAWTARWQPAGEALTGVVLAGGFLLALLYLSGNSFNPFIYYRF